MIKLGLTGGIGSGKSTIAQIFQELGAPVYYADIEAKKFLLQESVIEKLIALFGTSIVNENGAIEKAKLAAIVFTNEDELKKLNALIHPMLEFDFLNWVKAYKSEKYIVKEAAILFEAGFDQSVDKILTISTPVEQRIARVIKRDGVARQQVLDRISKQWTDEQREAKSDFVIRNADNDLILENVLEIHTILQSK